MDNYWPWIQNHLLAVTAIIITLVLIYHYFIERETGVRLTKRYRDSIFEAQSKIFLNATQYLISGNKDLAIKEFMNAVDINRETLETYFALGGLFRSNGEIEKAISIHRSLIARESISENTRLRALKELAIDFDKGGFIDKAVETYKDCLKINRDQYDVILSLCRIYEEIEEWDFAYHYRIMLSKVGRNNQGETISNILVQKAKINFQDGRFDKCEEDLEDAFRFAPTIPAKILRLKLSLFKGNVEQSKSYLHDLLREHPLYATFVFVSLQEGIKVNNKDHKDYLTRLDIIRTYFLNLEDKELLKSPSVILSKVRMLKEGNQFNDAFEQLKNWMDSNTAPSEIMKIEYIKLLIKMGKTDDAVKETGELLEGLHQSLTRHFCKKCGFNSDNIFWRCPQCYEWETIKFRWKV